MTAAGAGAAMPMAMEMPNAGMKAWFEDANFEERYQRNNKRGGLKNLRCFPTCSVQHKERGFCGRSVVVNVQGELLRNSENSEIVAIAEFVPADLAVPTFKPGNSYEEDDIEKRVRTSDSPLKPLMRAVMVRKDAEDAKQVFEFNRRRKGWHYGWAANKHSCNTLHCLRVYILSRQADGKLMCLSTFASSAFVLYCRRRRRFVKEIPGSAQAVLSSSAAAAAERKKNRKRALQEIDSSSDDQDLSDSASEATRSPKVARTTSDSESEATVVLGGRTTPIRSCCETPTGSTKANWSFQLEAPDTPSSTTSSISSTSSISTQQQPSPLDLAHFLVSLSKSKNASQNAKSLLPQVQQQVLHKVEPLPMPLASLRLPPLSSFDVFKRELSSTSNFMFSPSQASASVMAGADTSANVKPAFDTTHRRLSAFDDILQRSLGMSSALVAQLAKSV